ncbi:MAG: hypothetical protein ACRCVX_08470 [Shewanella sp.]
MLFRDYKTWIAYDETFTKRDDAIGFMPEQSAKYPATPMRVATQLQADRLTVA